MVICNFCHKQCNGFRGLSQHLRQTHNYLSLKEYWLKNLKPDNFSLNCPICGNEKKFYTLTSGFSPVCSNKSCLGKYVDSFSKNKGRIREKHYNEYECFFCKKKFNKLESLQVHLFGSSKKSCHNNQITPKDYYLRYINCSVIDIKCPVCKKNERFFKSMMKGFSPTCSSRECISSYGNWFRKPFIKKQRNFKNSIKCEVCGQFFEKDKGLASHISQSHRDQITTKDYYDKYFIKNESEKICKYCNKYTKFINIQSGYTPTCCEIKCIVKNINEIKFKNGTFLGGGYSNISIDLFNSLIEKYQIPKNRCRHYKLNGEYKICKIPILEKYKFRTMSYDFVILDEELKKPILVCEFQGTLFHLKKEDIWKRRHDKDIYGQSLLRMYRKDLIKKQYIQQKFPDSHYFEIWEDTIEQDCQKIYDFLSSIK